MSFHIYRQITRSGFAEPEAVEAPVELAKPVKPRPTKRLKKQHEPDAEAVTEVVPEVEPEAEEAPVELAEPVKPRPKKRLKKQNDPAA